MEHEQGKHLPTHKTPRQLQALARHGPGVHNTFDHTDYKRLILGWAALPDPREADECPGYYLWLGGDSIHYQQLHSNKQSSKEPPGQFLRPGGFSHDQNHCS